MVVRRQEMTFWNRRRRNSWTVIAVLLLVGLTAGLVQKPALAQGAPAAAPAAPAPAAAAPAPAAAAPAGPAGPAMDVPLDLKPAKAPSTDDLAKGDPGGTMTGT